MSPPNNVRLVLIVLALASLVITIYSPTRLYSFVYDDPEYVTSNPIVSKGLSPHGVVRAFSEPSAMNWHPLTILSHSLDVSLFGMDPGGHHLVNVAVHLANTVVLFFLLNSMTGALWRSAFVAALFAIHPLHVESVAWISERKDVLCGFFWLVATAAYIAYVRRGGWGRYLLVGVLFSASLLSKPMAVTFPFSLMLLDYWPLCRTRWTAGRNTENAKAPASVSFRHLVLEKIPLLGLSAIISIVTLLVQRRAMSDSASFPIPLRLANAVVSYAKYVLLTAWPSGLAVFYPHPGDALHVLAAWEIVGAAFVLCTLTILVLQARRRRPYLLMGWLFFLGTLVPVIGLVQVGAQAMGDRYTYIPLLGIFVAAVWGIPDVLHGKKLATKIIGSAGVIVIVLLAALAHIQVGYWENNGTLFSHALEVTTNNAVAHNNLADFLISERDNDRAAPHVQEALRIWPDFAEAWYNLGRIAYTQKDFRQAVESFRKAATFRPWYPSAWSNLGAAYLALGDKYAAQSAFRQVVNYEPDVAEGWYNVGLASASLGDFDGAMAAYREAIHIDPGYAKAWNNMGNILSSMNKEEEAVSAYSQALRFSPRSVLAWYNLGISSLRIGRKDQALNAETQLRELDPALAAALARERASAKY